jgi:hypothetical protein
MVDDRPVEGSEDLDLEVVRAEQPIPGKQDMSIEGGDALRTGPDLTAWLSLRGNAEGRGPEVVLFPDTDAEILQSPAVLLRSGRLFARSGKSLRVETPELIVEAETARFMLVRSSDEAVIVALGGQISVRSRADAWEPVAVQSGNNMTVAGGAAPAVRPVKVEQLNAMIRDLNNIERAVRPEPRSWLLVPYVTKLDQELALSTVQEEIGLDVGRVDRAIAPEEAGIVLDQSPPPGEVVRVGQEIDLVVGAEEVTVPKVTDLKPGEALVKLREKGLQGVVAETPRFTGEFEPGTINEQIPAGGESAARGSVVNLRIEGKDMPPLWWSVPRETSRTRR